MAQQQQKDLLSRLADAGEDAIQRLSKAPGGEGAVKAINSTRERIDDLQKKVRGIDALEKRVAVLEKKVDKLTKASKPARKPAARKPRTSPTKTDGSTQGPPAAVSPPASPPPAA
jgi:hypothetical protein